MEDDTKVFLMRIVNTISFVLIWMMVNVLLGIFFGFAFFEGRPDWKNVCYYIFFLVTLFFLVRYLWKKWEL